MRVIILVFFSLTLVACVSAHNRSKLSYDKKSTALKSDMMAIEKAGFLWADETMGKDESYMSRALDKAYTALGCDTRLIKIISREDFVESERLEKTCNYEAGLKGLERAEGYIQAAKKQMKNRKFALPSYEKKRN